jgi:hypothetical protein
MATPDKFGVPILSGADNYVYWSIKLLAWMERDNATSGNTETPFIGLNVTQNKRAISNIKLMCGPYENLHSGRKLGHLGLLKTILFLYTGISSKGPFTVKAVPNRAGK